MKNINNSQKKGVRSVCLRFAHKIHNLANLVYASKSSGASETFCPRSALRTEVIICAMPFGI